ncbi:aldehyde dehydrogenase, dimeric NADP-preferring [Conidiobolus coronatus NRRL 28638]|uniref:Aldehyde dehydrogenase n=1 Tax=Conidiobolus coronatus (strain ATCC 28846 / CBS 209.66 / NRRL 28638) TaxID=796925 RepID=A0A137P5U1_CONC2|nr:aldehyde dehydrogenase, dimeric NADP-preferring [Conidiobolus coronatus NRRL 28638]|eukprot:KXN70375.1 aldehyde dehydrogenase, dimeric NADP-preferring [Conidiobolus coronatus NRRL 28638]
MWLQIPQDLYNNTVLPEYEETNMEDIRGINEDLRAYFKTGVTKTYEWRVQQLLQLKKAFKEREVEIVKAMETDYKRSDNVLLEMHFCIDEIIYALENLKSWMKPQNLTKSWLFFLDKLTETRVPLGVVLNIAPWNFPINLAFSPLIGMIAAGNCVVLKPSEISSNSAAIIKQIVEDYLDTKAIKVINGGVEVTTEVLRQKWDHIMYTGNSQVGKIVMRAASEHLTPVTLELGGKNPVLIDTKTSNLETVCSRFLNAKGNNWGQFCLSPDYLVVLKGESDKLIDQLKLSMREFYGEDYKNTELWGRMINKNHTKRVIDLIPTADSSPEDGEVVIGGNYDLDMRFVELTFVKNVHSAKGKLMKGEIFGPIVPIIEFDSWNDAICYIQDSDKPLAAYLYSEDSKLIDQFKSDVACGSQAINEAVFHILNKDMSFGGLGNSGLGGGYHGYNTFKLFSHAMPTLQRSQGLEFVNKIRYSPRDMREIYPACYPTMFSITEGHSTFAQWLNLPFRFVGWVTFTVKIVVKTVFGF